MKFIVIGSIFGPFLGVYVSLLAVKFTTVGIASTIMAIIPVLIIPPAILILPFISRLPVIDALEPTDKIFPAEPDEFAEVILPLMTLLFVIITSGPLEKIKQHKDSILSYGYKKLRKNS